MWSFFCFNDLISSWRYIVWSKRESYLYNYESLHAVRVSCRENVTIVLGAFHQINLNRDAIMAQVIDRYECLSCEIGLSIEQFSIWTSYNAVCQEICCLICLNYAHIENMPDLCTHRQALLILSFEIIWKSRHKTTKVVDDFMNE